MKNKFYFYFYLVILFFISILNLFIGISHPNNGLYLLIGLFLIVANIGLFLLNDLTRKIMLLASNLFIFLVYIPLIILLFLGKLPSFSGMGVLVLAPVFILSLITISCLTKEDIKKRFKEKGQSNRGKNE